MADEEFSFEMVHLGETYSAELVATIQGLRVHISICPAGSNSRSSIRLPPGVLHEISRELMEFRDKELDKKYPAKTYNNGTGEPV